MGKENFENWKKEELIGEIKKLRKRKKYGIVWEDKLEEVVNLCKEKLPVLEEEKGKEIKLDENGPVHILIEGDNYHALSVLNYTHKNKIDVIYVDPPYNTGNEGFIFNDKIVNKEDTYRHSKWLSFISKRLKLSKSLLKESGILLISIDDNELSQLKLLCDEIFGEKNFIANLPTIMNLKGNQDQFGFAGTHEYTLVYAKNIRKAEIGTFEVGEEDIEQWEEDKYGFFKKGANLKSTGINAPREKRPNLYFPIFMTKKDDFYVTEDNKPLSKDDISVFPITDGNEMTWRWSKNKITQEKHNIIVGKSNGRFIFYKKQRPTLGDIPTKKPKSIFYKPEYSSGNGTNLQKNIFHKKVFDNPKPIKLIKDLILLTTFRKNGIVLDFTAGSGTTAHAVLELNKRDKTCRRFILCTNDENGICTEVCYPRIKKVLEGYKDLKGNKISGIKANLKYFKTDFVDAEPSDINKKKLVDKSTEMLCLREDCFDFFIKGKFYQIFTNSKEKNLAIIYEDKGIEAFKNEIKKLKKKFVVYIFSLDESAREEEFEDVSDLVELKPIPAVILNVYKRIFK